MKFNHCKKGIWNPDTSDPDTYHECGSQAQLNVFALGIRATIKMWDWQTNWDISEETLAMLNRQKKRGNAKTVDTTTYEMTDLDFMGTA